MLKRLSILKWVVDADPEATHRAHAAMPGGDPEACGCQGCRNFIAAREHAYPPEARKLFAELGILVGRESQVGGAIRLTDGRYHYSGFFHFVGSIVEGPAVHLKVADIEPKGDVQGGVVHSLSYEPLAGAFALSLADRRDLLPRPFGDAHVVQLEFTTEVPWCLADEPSE